MNKFEILDRAIIFATKAHAGQTRRDGAPYILHPLEDAAIVSTMTSDECVLAAAVLHDTVEDTSVSIEDIQANFGARVAELVGHETENKREHLPPQQTWKIRKEESLKVLEQSDDIAVKFLWLGDKLSNIRALHRLVRLKGEDAFLQFNNTDKNAHRWYYFSILQLLGQLKDFEAYKEFECLLHKIFD